jgi:mycothiol synthase
VSASLGTAAEHQRRGLGRSIVAEGVRRLRDFGAESARIASRSNSPAANALYNATGFPVVDRNVYSNNAGEA